MANPRFPLAADSAPGRVSNILYATPPFGYVAETADEWAAKGYSGFIRPDVMQGWDADVWELEDGTRIVGDDNPRFRAVQYMIDRLRAAGVAENVMSVAFSRHVPDWFDDEGWAQLVENLRQGAVFARLAGFIGVALDDEYIEEQWGLGWEPYRAAGLDRDALVAQARTRGRQIQRAMLDEFPEMVSFHLPEAWSIHGELSRQMFLGFLDVIAEADAPGGLHLMTETTYFMRDADWIARYGYGMDRTILDELAPDVANYWARRCGISVGLSPLGYLRFVRDEHGRRLGYGGRPEVFGDRILKAGEDKSGNYSAETFAETHAAARMVSRRYVWVFSGGPVWWQMTDDQLERYGGSDIATLPLTPEFDDYAETLRSPKIIDRPDMSRLMDAVANRTPTDALAGLGIPPAWWMIGPFTNEDGIGYDREFGPESGVHLDAGLPGLLGPAQWRYVRTPPSGYADMSRLVEGGVDICGYAATWIDLDVETDAVIRFGSDDAGRIWINGEHVHGVNEERINIPDEDIVPVRLPAGRSEVLLKIVNYHGGWGFYFRVTDAAGDELPGLTYPITA